MLLKSNFQSGFTLIELMIGIAIGGVLLAIAIPGFSDLQKNNCLTASTNSLVTSLQLARSIAIKRNTDVTLTANNSSTDASDNEWGTGWVITIDEDRNGNDSLDTGEDYNGNAATVTTPESAALVRTVTLGCTLTKMDGDQDTLVSELSKSANS
ncbi:MAG: GspH/FimT family pseudopilin [Proteobacteria bacterium]|nr:GspH/FimT family pseudopilin [Pseudomonadota bacterium]